MELETAWCPCQEARFDHYYPDHERSDMPYVDEVDFIERVHSQHYWDQQTSDRAFSSGPSAPTTRRGVAIVDSNFPEADFVCPCCEKEYVEEVTIRPVD